MSQVAMASYIEIRPDDDELEIDYAQPSTSTSSDRMKRSDTTNSKPPADVTFDVECADSEASQQSASKSSSQGRHNSKKQANHASSVKRNEDVERKEPEHGTESEMREFEFCIKSPLSDGPIIDLRGREVLFAIGVFFFLSVSIGLIVVLASDRYAAAKKNKALAGNGDGDVDPGMCLTKECMSRAADMMDMMDQTANPCDDFWRYSCGGWLDKNEIPPSQKSWGVDKELGMRVQGYVRRILNSDIHDGRLNSTERKMKTFFRSCMDLDAIDDLGTREIMAVMDRMGGWAIFDDWNLTPKPGRWGFQTVLKELHHRFYIHVFFTMFVRPDDKMGGKVVQFDQSVLPYPDVHHGMPEQEEAYLTYLREVATLMGAPQRNVEDFVNQTWSFEKEIVKIQISEMDMSRMDPNAMYNRLTIDQLQTTSPRILWLHYIRELFPAFTAQTEVLVTDLDYFRNLSRLLSSTDERVMNYYMMWRLVDDFTANLPDGYRKAREKFMKVHTGRRLLKSRDQYCVDKTNDAFGFQLGASFAEEYLPPDNKKELNNLTKYIKEELHTALNESDWLDEPTKEEAINKLHSFEVKFGYPDFILDPNMLAKYYSEFSISSNESFFQLNINYCKHEISQTKMAYHGTILGEAWIMSLYESNAYFNPMDNILVLPAGVLQKPYFDKALPHYVNYGSIGSVVAHEMNHAYNGMGASYDSNGIMRVWWSMSNFETSFIKMQCVADYYSGLTYEGHTIHGDLIANEAIADLEGLRLAYKAYHNMMESKKEEARMPGINTSNDKVFFLAFAQNYCKKRRKDLIESYLENSQHLIEKLRVIGTLSQLKEFSDAYNCPAKAPMNLKERCNLWKN